MYSIEEEMTVTAADFLRLRSGWSYFNLKKAEKVQDTVLHMLSDVLQLNPVQKDAQRTMLRQLFRNIHELPANEERQKQATS
jgi:glycerol-3-phosphate dehydrogenase